MIGTIILHTTLTISIIGVLCAFILYMVDQKFKVDENPGTGDISSTLAQAIDIMARDRVYADKSKPIDAMPCIRCARCVSVCPAGLEPYLLMHLSEKQLWQRAEQEDMTDCTECGFCNDACPANQPLLENIRFGKSKIGNLNNS